MKHKIFSSLFPFFIIAEVLLLILPIPPFVLDLLLSFSILFSIMALFLSLHIETIFEFNAFPSLLLYLTLFRLGLNIASTRLILTRGEAGAIIQTFGEFAASKNLLIGFLIFGLLTIINFIVITKGSLRIAEVSARFTLEAIPGKQMAVDSDLQAGNISEEEAKEGRDRIKKESEFYGAMDGASKFVRGDAIASLLITALNLLGGIIFGLFSEKMELKECLFLYTYLTIGDGLVTQLPALLVSLGAATMITRVSEGRLSTILPSQLFKEPMVLFMGGVALLFLSFIPGMPLFILLPLTAITLFFSFYLKRDKGESKGYLEGETVQEDKKIEDALLIHPISVYLGEGLIPFAKPLLEEVPEIRRFLAKRLGIVIPNITIRDQLSLPPFAFLIKIRGLKVAINEGKSLQELTRTLIEVLQDSASELINRQDVAKMIETAKIHNLAVVEELIPHKLNHGQILKVLQNLLKEKVTIRDFVTILEVLADSVTSSEVVDTDLLTENVRKGLSKIILENVSRGQRKLFVITLDTKVEEMIVASFKKGHFGATLLLRPQTMDKIRNELKNLIEKSKNEKIKPIVLTTVSTRRSLRFLIEKQLPELPVLSFAEVEGEMEIETIGTISNEVLI